MPPGCPTGRTLVPEPGRPWHWGRGIDLLHLQTRRQLADGSLCWTSGGAARCVCRWLVAKQGLHQCGSLVEPPFPGEARRLDHVGQGHVGNSGIVSILRRGPSARPCEEPVQVPIEIQALLAERGCRQRIRSANAALTAGPACSAPRTKIEAMAARASSGVTSDAMLTSPRIRIVSGCPAARAALSSWRLYCRRPRSRLLRATDCLVALTCRSI